MSEDSFHLGIKALIRKNDGRVLLLKVNPVQLEGAKVADYWDLPGGRIQKNHTVQDTLRREVLEETGLDTIRDIKPLGMTLSKLRIPVGDDSVGLILSVFLCTIPEDSAITISDEHIGYDWFEPTKAAELLQIKYPVEFCKLIGELR